MHISIYIPICNNCLKLLLSDTFAFTSEHKLYKRNDVFEVQKYCKLSSAYNPRFIIWFEFLKNKAGYYFDRIRKFNPFV